MAEIEANPHLLEALTAFHEIGASINALGIDGNLDAALRLIATRAVRVVGVGASAVIYAYDATTGRFDPASRVAAGEGAPDGTLDYPRPDGLGARALQERRRILSYELPEIGIHPAQRAAGAQVVACYPLIVADEPVGVLYVCLRHEHRFTPEQLLLLDNFVNLAATAIYHARQLRDTRRNLARKIEELEELRRAERLISSRLRLDDTLHEILRIGLQMTGAEYGSFRLLDKDRGLLILSAIAGPANGDLPHDPLPVDTTSIVGWVAIHRTPLRIPDLTAEPWSKIYRPLLANQTMRSELAVPLLGAGGGLEGVLNLESPAVNAFSSEDERLLQTLGTQAVIAIQEAKLLDAMQEIVEQLLVRSREELFDLVIRRACDLINAPIGAIWTLAEDDPNTLILRKATGGHRRGDVLPVHGSLTGRAVSERQPITCPDVRYDPSFRYVELAREQGWVSALIVPLLGRDRQRPAMGAFSVYTTEPREFSNWDQRLVSCLASHAAIAIQDAEQLEQLKKVQERQAVAETFAAIGDIAANLLHRLNNKIGTIPVRIQGIEAKCPGALKDPYLANSLQEIKESARAAMEIVRDSMVHLRPIHLQPVAVNHCIRQALQEVNLPATIQVSQSGLDDLPPVMAGEEQLKLVFVNLIENAIDAMKGRGKLWFTGRRRGQWIEITVTDNGPGIPVELQERIFELNFSTKRTTKKLGFGLWWTRTYIQRFGGTLQVESTPGQGATFIVRLPVATSS
jgi:signal transduction histidine kinase